MVYHEMIASEIAEKLLQIKAIKLSPQNPFTWASGWRSPIYCDNRKTLSYPEIRNMIRDKFCELIRERFPEAEVIAGVATAGIPHGVLIADKLEKPFIYVRSTAKGHGLQNMIEGVVEEGRKVVVVEDLISTGRSSLEAVEALRTAGCEILGLVAIFSYDFEVAKKNFSEAGVRYFTLSDYNFLIKYAAAQGQITSNVEDSLTAWRRSPQNWQP